jgi:hypothetical protein
LSPKGRRRDRHCLDTIHSMRTFCLLYSWQKSGITASEVAGSLSLPERKVAIKLTVH